VVRKLFRPCQRPRSGTPGQRCSNRTRRLDLRCPQRAHAPRPVLKRQTSQVRNTKTVGHAQPKRMAIERVSPLTCDGSLGLLPWEAKAQATFNAQPVATAIAAAARPFKWERDLTSQKSRTGSRRAVSNRAVVANFFMMSLNGAIPTQRSGVGVRLQGFVDDRHSQLCTSRSGTARNGNSRRSG